MQMYDLITKKKHGKALSAEEIDWLVNGYTDGSIPDYMMSAFLMAVYFKSMNDEETTALTLAMARSGDMLDLSDIGEITVDKHSTGGVGDKTTLVIVPAVAACGVKAPKMSGRGLGHTGGTIDKLESIPGFSTALGFEEFKDVVRRVGCAVVGQTGQLTPADKKLYALRDVTATVDSIPLIASSIMSKKLATGNSCIVLDVKCGSGAFMKTQEDAKALADTMVRIGELSGRKCRAIISDMDKPLGRTVGNSLEVMEAIETLKGNEKGEFYETCIELIAAMLLLAGKGETSECEALAREAISSGKALAKFREMVAAQGGNPDVTENYELLGKATYSAQVLAEKDGTISGINCEEVGLTALMLGAGRTKKDAPIDSTAGIILNKLSGESVKKGELVATLYSSSVTNFDLIIDRFLAAYPII